jgi:tripartite-type tricarboxylate transporter receptor subunit TctC
MCASSWSIIMKLPRRTFLYFALVLATLPTGSRTGWAQNYPTRPVTMIVPYAAGGPTDALARVLAEKMRASLGQAVIVENVPGGGGSIGVGRVARAAPDGYTIDFGNNGSNVLVGALYSLPFDLISDFEPVAELTTNPQIITSKNAIPARNLTELITWLRGNQIKVSVGVAGPVAAASVINFQNMTSTQFQLVPYRGGAPAIQDLMGGQIDLMIDQLSNAIPQIKVGTVKAYAVAAKSRSPAAPEIPTVDEAGLPGLYGSLWHGLWAPKGTPRDVIAKLNAAVKEALVDPTVKQRLADVGQEIVPVEQQNPQALGAHQKAEIEKWWPIAKAANLKGE